MATIYTNITANKWRTTITMTLFIFFVIGLGYIFSSALNMEWLFPLAIIIAVSQAFTSYFWSDRVALAISGAKEVQKNDAPELYRLVENISITAGLPTPRVYIIEDEAPNAFATGRDPKHSAIAVTTGLLHKLNKAELEGVVAHEFSHIGNYDIRLSAVIVVLVGFVVLISDWFLHIRFWGDDDNNNSGQFGAIMMIVGIILALLSPLFASLIQLAISRKREFLADADGALLTRNPNGLADALEKITSDTAVFRRANKATAHLFIASPLKNEKGESQGFFSGLFETHPNIGERIKRLREMAL